MFRFGDPDGPTGRVFDRTADALLFLQPVPREQIYCLVEVSNGGQGVSPTSLVANTVVWLYSSPALAVNSDVKKMNDQAHLRLWCPMWPQSELLDASAALKVPFDIEEEKERQAAVSARFLKFGGIPRFCLSNKDLVSTHEKDQQLRVDNMHKTADLRLLAEGNEKPQPAKTPHNIVGITTKWPSGLWNTCAEGDSEGKEADRREWFTQDRAILLGERHAAELIAERLVYIDLEHIAAMEVAKLISMPVDLGALWVAKTVQLYCRATTFSQMKPGEGMIVEAGST